MSVVPHDFSFEPVADASGATSATPARGRRGAAVLRAIAWLPRIVLNCVLVGVLGLVLMMMWAPGHIEANERQQREWRRPPVERGWWGRRDRGPNAPRPERSSPR